MKLYEVNAKLESLLDEVLFDEETGEILAEPPDLSERFEALQMERQRILEYLAKLVINTRAEVAALKEEERRLKDRRSSLEAKEDRLMKILDRECGGTKTDLGVATFSYRKTSHVDVSDSAKAVRWLKRNKHHSCYRTPEPEVAKAEVKKLINAGVKVPGCAIVEDYSCSLK